MEEYLPYYMIPKHFIRLEELPRTKTGKLNRKALPKPIKAVATSYEAPTNEIEEKFCKTFEKVLGVERIGIDTDLFELGLTSLTTIEAITELDLDEIESMDIYRSRTVKELAKYYSEARETYLTPMERELEGRKHLYPLQAMALFMFYGQTMNKAATMFNMSGAYKFGKLVKIEKLRDAVNRYMDASSTFKTQIVFNENKQPCYKYNPNMYKPVEIEHMTETEVEDLKHNFIQPFNLLEEAPYRIRLIKTNKSSYIFIDMHHIMTDAAGMQLMGEDIYKAYMGEELPENNFFRYCYDFKKETDSPLYEIYKETINERFYGKGWQGMPKRPGKEKYNGEHKGSFGITTKKLNAFLNERNITRDVFFCAVELLANAKIGEKNNIVMSWTYKNRDEISNHAGLRVKSPVIGIKLSNKMTIQTLYEEIIKEKALGISQSLYQFPLVYDKEKAGFNLLNLDDLLDARNPNAKLKIIGKPVQLDRPGATNDGYNILEIYNDNDTINFRFVADNTLMDDERRSDYADSILEIAERLLKDDESVIADCVKQ